ncbi:MAG TPA: UDP-glucose 4-epimerase GalE [Acidobacteriota bacterium]|nr:UDP-glucose 4-epimerase GalE [Acidobacteriota bacterium]HQF86408.1 UDP-glucose 4-epimerase GalE [Acidobacteriota bacterium]HQG90349.1 UDP-glucose 4-epimerase GalE [Acidobacteriota bacterium]HQK86714.1 UDP-glucose 4-epimerase GalE [Acidobacteriota bacterium]
MKVVVTGGAGYIGSHTVQCLRRRGMAVHVFDDLSTGHRAAVLDAEFRELDLRHREAVAAAFATVRPDAVIHFAAHCYVGESVVNPRRYFEDNLATTLNVLGAMVDTRCRRFVFSSTCATYGDPVRVPIPEDHPQHPVNPYGESKLFIERILHRYHEAYGLRYAALRYFNAAGADPDGRLGESHDPETHLIPLIIRAVLDPGFSLTVFGDDYPTPDGTCIRDYIHVTDLADAHVRALDRLAATDGSFALNLGTGHGYSVLEMIRRLEAIAGRPVQRTTGPRRAGDPPVLVAAADRAAALLGWQCTHSSIDEILATAWRWHQAPRF